MGAACTCETCKDQTSNHARPSLNHLNVRTPNNSETPKPASSAKQSNIKESIKDVANLSDSELCYSDASVSEIEASNLEIMNGNTPHSESIDPDEDDAPIMKLNTFQISDVADDILVESPKVNDLRNSDQLEEYTTPMLEGMAEGFLDDIQLTIRQSVKDLVPMKDWLFKKQSSPPYSWQKRWVVLRGGYLLWSDRQMTIENGITSEEKQRWNKCIKVGNISSVTIHDSKKERKFCVNVCKVDRPYIFKATSKTERDKWMSVIQQHIEFSDFASVYSKRSSEKKN